MYGSFYFSACKSASCFCLRIIGTVYLRNSSFLIFNKTYTFYKICMHQTDFIAREQPEVFFRRFLHKILSLNVELSAERNFPGTQLFIFQIVCYIQILCPAFRIIVNYKFNRIKNSHHSRLFHFQVFPDTVLKHGIINRALCF